ncbi:type I-B CRISPR-associated protein Cas5b [Compostibacter hankyongensis]|uniref:Type I-B CRISPR-associated protein Cas5 n=1 Tax=Compostibacter hankyongensis TaxID=1007089 RepID=A0ABP8G6B2_9BACT
MKLISFDLKADFAFFRQPDTNATINLSYNIIHRPVVLGILGAIIGLDGYQEKGKLPQYYEVLKDVAVGIEPLNHDKGNYTKTNIKYSNTIGYANKGTNFLTEELTLVNPEYRIYLLLDEQNAFHSRVVDYINGGNAEYIPYLGKNEFTAWWNADSYKEYQFNQKEITEESVRIQTVFHKKNVLSGNTETPVPDFVNFKKEETPFIYFERLPKDFDLALMQYEIADFAFSNYLIKNAQTLGNLYFIEKLNAYAQLL